MAAGSSVRIIEEFLQAFGQNGWKSLQPGCVYQVDTDKVSDMGSIFVPEGCQFHFDQGFE